MYHIKKDKRSQKSAELIYEGLSHCMEVKTFDKITITDIQHASSVGRATFYRDFDNIKDVLYWQCDAHYQEVMNGYFLQSNGNFNPYNFIKYFFDYWISESNSNILEQIISIGYYDIIFSCHFKNSSIIKNNEPKSRVDENDFFEYYLSTLIGGFIGLLVSWISNGKIFTADEIIEKMKAEDNKEVMTFFSWSV